MVSRGRWMACTKRAGPRTGPNKNKNKGQNQNRSKSKSNSKSKSKSKSTALTNLGPLTATQKHRWVGLTLLTELTSSQSARRQLSPHVGGCVVSAKPFHVKRNEPPAH